MLETVQSLHLLAWCEVDHRRVQTGLAINRELKAGRPITSARYCVTRCRDGVLMVP